MSCPAPEQLYLYAADVLEDAERSAVEAHLETDCARCHDALDEERRALTAIAESLPPIAPPPRVRARLLERARGGPQRGRRPPERRSAAPRRIAMAASLAAAAALGFGLASWRLGAEYERGTAAAKERLQNAREEVARLEGQLVEQDEELVALEAEVEGAADVADLLGTPDLVALALAPTAAGSTAWGRVLWDADYRCYFRAAGLETLPAEEHYVVWMVGPDEQTHAAGTLVADALGRATLFTRLPRELSPVVRSFVTAETTPEPDEPSDRVVLLGLADTGDGEEIEPADG